MMKDTLISYWKASKLVTDNRLIEAFSSVPREKFVLERFVNEAYGDYPLPILSNQTISQPTTIMIMTQALELKLGERVLEVGAGSGYQAALIAYMVGSKGRVITTEIIPELVGFARGNLEKAGVKNVEVVHYDGSQGYEKEAPYDKIIVTAACPNIPEPLIEQLKIEGILVAPVGSIYTQEMLKLKKLKKDKLDMQSLGEFFFVPLVGKHGYK